MPKGLREGRSRSVTDSVDVLDVACGAIRAVTLEGEVVLRVLRIHVVDGHASLDAAQGKAGGCAGLPVSEDADATVLQWDRCTDI